MNISSVVTVALSSFKSGKLYSHEQKTLRCPLHEIEKNPQWLKPAAECIGTLHSYKTNPKASTRALSLKAFTFALSRTLILPNLPEIVVLIICWSHCYPCIFLDFFFPSPTNCLSVDVPWIAKHVIHTRSKIIYVERKRFSHAHDNALV